MKIEECERRVTEWARHVARSGATRGTCGSVEGRYVAPRPDDAEVARSAQVPIDVDDAEQVERLMNSVVKTSAKRLLTMLYVEGVSKSFIRSRCSISIETIDSMRRRCLDHVGQCIQADNARVHVIRRGSRIWNGTDNEVAPAKKGEYIPLQFQTTRRKQSPAKAGGAVDETKKEPA